MIPHLRHTNHFLTRHNSKLYFPFMDQNLFPALDRARDLLGSYSAIGRVCGVSFVAVLQWRKRGRLPRTEYTGETQYAIQIEQATNGAVHRSELRPDLWEPPEPALEKERA